MDWKELQKRLDEYNNSPVSKNTRMVLNSTTQFRPEDMQKVYEICRHGTVMLTHAYQQVTGKKGIDGNLIKRWFVSRGYPEFRIFGRPTKEWFQKLQNYADKGLSSREIAEIYGLEPDTVDAYFQRGKLKRKKKVTWYDRMKPLVEQGLTNQEIYDRFPETKKSLLASYLTTTKNKMKKNKS